MLVVKDLVSGYSKMPAIHGVSFKVEEGQIVAILGSNGAGKTTTLKTVMGIYLQCLEALPTRERI